MTLIFFMEGYGMSLFVSIFFRKLGGMFISSLIYIQGNFNKGRTIKQSSQPHNFSFMDCVLAYPLTFCQMYLLRLVSTFYYLLMQSWKWKCIWRNKFDPNFVFLGFIDGSNKFEVIILKSNEFIMLCSELKMFRWWDQHVSWSLIQLVCYDYYSC